MDGISVLALVKEFGEGARVGRGGEFYAELRGDGLDAIPTLRSFDHAPNRQRTSFFEKGSDGDVGRNHEAFNDVLGNVVLADGHLLHNPIFDFRGGFDRTEGERAM